MVPGEICVECFEKRSNQGDRNGGHLTGCGGLISVPVAQYVSVAIKREDLRKSECHCRGGNFLICVLVYVNIKIQ